jgi:DNA invertase Pin-like site-specific DNA recombinase
MANNGKVKAVAYLRTSSAANIGEGKDSDKRQLEAVTAFAYREGYEIVETFYDKAVKGADPIEVRPGFAALLDRIEGNGVRTVLVDEGSRFARELIPQELGILALINRGVRVFTANGDELTDNSDPSRVMMRQIAGAFYQYEKARLVSKLKGARERKRRDTGQKVEGRKSYIEAMPGTVQLACELSFQPRSSLRKIAATMSEAGHVTANGRPFSHSAVAAMIRRAEESVIALRLRKLGVDDIADRLGIAVPTVQKLIGRHMRPGRPVALLVRDAGIDNVKAQGIAGKRVGEG